jgi:putative ABC transport system ATP-binding protein
MAAGHDIDPIWAREVLGTLGIDQPEFLKGSTANLSGGEQQRVAIARGLVHKPDILFADEPTSALDSERTVEVHGLLASMVEDHGVTVVMVSHDPLSELYASHIEVMRDGQMVA